MKTRNRVQSLALASAIVFGGAAAQAREIFVSGSIQSAVNAARPGDPLPSCR